MKRRKARSKPKRLTKRQILNALLEAQKGIDDLNKQLQAVFEPWVINNTILRVKK